MTTNDHRASGTLTDPAADAAAMLLRLGFAIFALVIPSATLMSRWVIVVLVPIGAVLIILSSLLRADSARLSVRALSHLASGPGLACLLLVGWALVSLLWTPVRWEAAEKLFKLLGVVLLGFFAVIALPQRMRATNLHLITIGVALGATLILVGSVSALVGQPVLSFPPATPERIVILLSVLGWIGAAWLLIKNRRSMAFALMVLVITAIALGPNRAAFGPLAASLLVLALAWNRPEAAGRIVGLVVAAAILLLPFASAFGSQLGMAGLERWWQMILDEPLHFLTGRGFDAGNAARVIGVIGPELPVSLISDLWFDLGVLGALFFAIPVAWAFIAAGKLGYELAPATLAALSAAMTVALFDRNATQTWWFHGLAVFAIVLMSVERGRYRTLRPRAEINP
ncbi:MAG: hypothetical protein IOB85_14470 [Methylobacterium sp.]|nr:hypothetical protein [Methylobacterium sp.]MCA3655789.1 hypothetical protein [Methylobacterium sp.]MCA3657963.1 hypothetical protein [Methylobacterium sp.]MCA3662617.1 hypothetical protein [Methylobacterium sp.]MCA3665765.1 hypothetical protein [Methylobacterium sp.]